MRSLILTVLGFSFCSAQSLPPTPILVGAGFSSPFPILVAPGQLLTLFVQPPAGYDATEPMPTISAVFWNGSDEAMPVLNVQQANTGCVIPGNLAACPNLLAVTVQVPFDAPINPAAGSNVVVRPSGIAVFVSGEKSFYFGAQALADHVHIVTGCDALFNAAPIEQTDGMPCAPIITHSDGSSVSALIPAVAGEELVAYATGLGQTTPALTTGQPAATSSPTVTTFNLDFDYRANALATNPGAVGATVASPLYAGTTKGYIGLYQINFIVPPPPHGLEPCVDFAVNPDLATGGNVIRSNLTVSVGSIFSFDGAGICVQP